MSPTTAAYTGHRAATIAGFLAIAAGAMHVGIALMAYRPVFVLSALWFAGTGVAMMLMGVLTLFARNTPAGSLERWAAFGANIAGLIIATSYSIMTSWSEWRGFVEIVIFIAGAAAALVGGKDASRTAVNEPPRRP